MKACTRSRVEATLYLGATRSEDCILPISQSDLREPLHLPAAQKVGGGRLNHSPENESWKPLPSSSLPLAVAWVRVEDSGRPQIGSS